MGLGKTLQVNKFIFDDQTRVIPFQDHWTIFFKKRSCMLFHFLSHVLHLICLESLTTPIIDSSTRRPPSLLIAYMLVVYASRVWQWIIGSSRVNFLDFPAYPVLFWQWKLHCVLTIYLLTCWFFNLLTCVIMTDSTNMVCEVLHVFLNYGFAWVELIWNSIEKLKQRLSLLQL